MNKIERLLKEVIKEYKPAESKKQELKSFEEASDQFEELVKSGVASKRGHKLLSIDKAHLNHFKIHK